ncbi:hypothetical protein RFI_00769, partial [Reticulomyxa filosa]
MFFQANQVATENDYNEDIWNQLDPSMEMESKYMDEKLELKANEEDKTFVKKTHDIWEQYFNGDSIAKYVLRRVGDNKYQFIHKSCQEYYAAQKIILDIISWKPDIVTVDNQQFQQQFETHVQKLFINHKLLNEELGIIQFIAERIPIFVNLKSRLFRIIEISKNNENVSQQLQLLEGHTDDINGIQLSPDGLNILSYSLDKTMRIWDLLSGKQLQ